MCLNSHRTFYKNWMQKNSGLCKRRYLGNLIYAGPIYRVAKKYIHMHSYKN